MIAVSQDKQLREHVLHLLKGGSAHLDFDKAIVGLPSHLRGAKPDGVKHTPWRLLEHLRICQRDILEYSRNPDHISADFPDGYWPDGDGPPSDEAWEQSVEAFRTDLQAMQELVNDPTIDLMAQIPHGQPGHTVLREALLVADHNAYHLGQLVVVRRALGAWTDD